MRNDVVEDRKKFWKNLLEIKLRRIIQEGMNKLDAEMYNNLAADGKTLVDISTRLAEYQRLEHENERRAREEVENA